jgi:oligopeptidase B
MDAPIAKKEAMELEMHNDHRIDNYYWMRLSDEQKKAKNPDAQTKEVVEYLQAENKYTKTMMAHTEGLQTKLYDEIIGRIKQTDQSVPYTYNGYIYYTRFEEGLDYPFNCRKKDEEGSKGRNFAGSTQNGQRTFLLQYWRNVCQPK